jgi:hypothetical protein
MNFCNPIGTLSVCMDIDISNIDFDEYNSVESEGCYFCGVDKHIVNAYVHSKKLIVNACVFCNMIVNFKRYNMGKIMLCNTSMTQLQVIRKTHELFNKNKLTPLPTLIDPKVKHIHISPMIYAKFIQSLDNLDKTKFNKFVFFFTSEVDKMIVPRATGINRNMFAISKQIVQSVPYNLDFFDIPAYELKLNEKEYIETFINDTIEKNHKLMQS